MKNLVQSPGLGILLPFKQSDNQIKLIKNLDNFIEKLLNLNKVLINFANHPLRQKTYDEIYIK